MLAELLQGEIFAFFLVFARLGSALMLLPGFGEIFVSTRIRLVFAFAMTVVVTPLVAEGLPNLPAEPISLAVLILGEIIVGVFLGSLSRLLLSMLQTAGTLIAHTTNLAAAQIFDPAQGTQGSLPGNFLTLMAILLIFVTNLHHVMLAALVGSYESFPAGVMPPLGDLAQLATRIVADGFFLALQIATPMIAVALMFQAVLGLMARLMPQMHVFFVGMPVQVMLGFSVFAIVLATAMAWYLDHFQQPLLLFLPGG